MYTPWMHTQYNSELSAQSRHQSLAPLEQTAGSRSLWSLGFSPTLVRDFECPSLNVNPKVSIIPSKQEVQIEFLLSAVSTTWIFSSFRGRGSCIHPNLPLEFTASLWNEMPSFMAQHSWTTLMRMWVQSWYIEVLSSLASCDGFPNSWEVHLWWFCDDFVAQPNGWNCLHSPTPPVSTMQTKCPTKGFPGTLGHATFTSTALLGGVKRGGFLQHLRGRPPGK